MYEQKNQYNEQIIMYNEQNIKHSEHLIVQSKYQKMNITNKRVNIAQQFSLQTEQIIQYYKQITQTHITNIYIPGANYTNSRNKRFYAQNKLYELIKQKIISLEQII